MRADRLLAALLVLASGAAAAAVDLGTLFTTPEERARLDRLRRGEPVIESRGTPGQRAVTGYVKRSDGRSTVWIDGVPLQVATPKAGSQLDPDRVRSYGSDDSRVRIETKPAAPR